MSEMILELRDGDTIQLELPAPIHMTVDQGRGPQGRPGNDGADSTVPGPKGDKGDDGADSTVPGPPGEDGSSAYEVAVSNGFVGTEAEWLESLVGPEGPEGAASTVPGPPGSDGADSTVPGPKGDKGDKGDTGDPGADSTVPGPPGSDGADGDSAYEVAVNNGFSGTEEEWLTSLVGPEGPEGPAGADGDTLGILPWIVVTDPSYGATGDGSTDDTAAINAAIAALNAAGQGLLYFPAGNYKCTDELDPITAHARILGDGAGDLQAQNAASKLTLNATTGYLMTLSADGMIIDSIGFENPTSTTQTAGAGIRVTQGDLNRYRNVSVRGFFDCVAIEDGCLWTMNDCYFVGPKRYSLRVRHIDLVDGGDMSINGCAFYAEDRHATAGISYESGGGMKISNSKFNTLFGTASFDYGIHVNPTGVTGVLTIVGNSFENLDNRAIFGEGGSSFASVAIVGNEIAYYVNKSVPAVDINGWLEVSVVGNTFLARGGVTGDVPAVLLTGVDGGSVGLNTFRGFSEEYKLVTCTGITTTLTGAVPTSREINPGTGLNGGGDLSGDVTLGLDTTAEAERIRDVIAAALEEGSGVTISVDDAANTITISAIGGGGGDAAFLDDLTDVDVTTSPPSDGNALIFDDASNLWVPGEPSGGGGGGGVLLLEPGDSVPGGTAVGTLIFRKGGFNLTPLRYSPSAIITLDESSGVFADVSGNGLDFTAGSGVTRGKTPLVPDGGHSASGDGSHDIASVASNGGLGLASTIIATVKTPLGGTMHGGILGVGSGGSNGYGLSFGNGGTTGANGRFLMGIAPGVNYISSGYQLPAGVADLGLWRIGMTLNGNIWRWFVNGQFVGEGTLTPNTPDAKLTIGSAADVLSSTVDVDHAVFIPSVLTPAQMVDMTSVATTFGAVGWWDGSVIQPLASM